MRRATWPESSNGFPADQAGAFGTDQSVRGNNYKTYRKVTLLQLLKHGKAASTSMQSIANLAKKRRFHGI